MTQVEFENQMRELRVQKGAALTAIARLQGEVKDDMEAIDRQIHELKERKAKLNQQRIALSDRRFALEQEWGKRIKDFQDANYTTTRTLENVSEWLLVKELSKRGYFGNLDHADKHGDFLINLNSVLNDTGKDTQEPAGQDNA